MTVLLLLLLLLLMPSEAATATAAALVVMVHGDGWMKNNGWRVVAADLSSRHFGPIVLSCGRISLRPAGTPLKLKSTARNNGGNLSQIKFLGGKLFQIQFDRRHVSRREMINKCVVSYNIKAAPRPGGPLPASPFPPHQSIHL